MRRFILLSLALFVIFSAAISVDAATQASSVKVYATVTSDSACQMEARVTLHIEQPLSQLTFPLPLEATNITVNGSRAKVQNTDTAKLVDLSTIVGTMVGDFTVTVFYTLDDVVHTGENDRLELQLPMLSGFVHPVQSMEFSVTLPGEIPEKPEFSSGYHQANIEKDLTYVVSDRIISGYALKALKDHETLTMTLPVSAEMFPQPIFILPDYDALNLGMALSAVLALVYWLVTLRCAPPRRRFRAIPPDGCTAGELGCVLNLKGANLTHMVFTWAELGYLVIHLDRYDRVTLHKCMDMGNERSAFEVRIFQALFGSRAVVATDSSRFINLWRKTEQHAPNLAQYTHPRSGNPRIFRILAAGVALFGGASLGMVLASGAVLQWLLVVLLAIAGGIAGFRMQRWAYELFFLEKHRTVQAACLAVAWILVDILAGFTGISLLVIFSQALAGLLAAFGGRRSEEGRLAMSYTLGLRRYLAGVSRHTLEPILENQPDYFHAMAPYALALGVDRAFARHFGKTPMPSCPYLTTGKELNLSAAQWSQLLRRTVQHMETGVHRKFLETAADVIKSFTK